MSVYIIYIYIYIYIYICLSSLSLSHLSSVCRRVSSISLSLSISLLSLFSLSLPSPPPCPPPPPPPPSPPPPASSPVLPASSSSPPCLFSVLILYVHYTILGSHHITTFLNTKLRSACRNRNRGLENSFKPQIFVLSLKAKRWTCIICSHQTEAPTVLFCSLPLPRFSVCR